MMERKPRLEKKVALITGASRGIGRAMAIRFAEEGASVAVNYVQNQQAAEEVCQRIVSAGGRAISIRADVAEASQVRKMAETVLSEFRHIDILVNNAAIFMPSTLLETSFADLDRMFDVNLKGIIHCVQAVARNMIERKYGRILNLGSIAGLGTAMGHTSVYAPIKAAVVSLTKRLALELGPHNITVNAIAPGFTRTDAALRDGGSGPPRSDLDLIARKAMLGRIGEPDDIAYPALFLVSDEASFVTAQTLTVDGGRMDFLTHST